MPFLNNIIAIRPWSDQISCSKLYWNIMIVGSSSGNWYATSPPFRIFGLLVKSDGIDIAIVHLTTSLLWKIHAFATNFC